MAKVLTAMSGGVDSSAAAILLQNAGHTVGGATMLLSGNTADMTDAASVCHALGIPHEVFDCMELFQQRVIDGFVSSYLAGETPNPCIECNRFLKFGEFLRRAALLGYERIATGHYARIAYDPASARYLLRKAKDHAKDQSYVLYALTQAQLAQTLFPLGDYTKAEVRGLAVANRFGNAQKPESQDICFIKDGDYKGFIERCAGPQAAGDFVDASGNVLGRHSGIANYTVGQRRGIGMAAGERLYVCKKDAAANTVTLGGAHTLDTSAFTARAVNWVAIESLTAPQKAMIRIRYNGTEYAGTVHPVSETEVRVEFDRPQRAVSPGQAAVFYNGDVVLGGGTIC